MKTNLATIQSDIRCDIHKQSRPYLRKLDILDFPNEMLLGIFELVEGCEILSFRDAFDVNREDMKNIRLVCRRFCAASSHLLVRNVRVTFNEASLVHLEEVSRHPTIAKGVRSILVTFDLYNRSFLDFERFISHHADVAEEEEQDSIFDLATYGKPSFEMTAKVEAVVSTLHRLASAYSDESGH